MPLQSRNKISFLHSSSLFTFLLAHVPSQFCTDLRFFNGKLANRVATRQTNTKPNDTMHRIARQEEREKLA